MLFGTLCKVHERALLTAPEVEAATIPVEKIQGAILLMSGRRDRMWPSTAMCQQIMSRLAARRFPHPYSHEAFNAGHNDYILKRSCQQAIHAFLKEHHAEPRI
jgi:hypothetical protein